ncbi:MAG: nucleotidyltransferase domain-containing protein [Candidatus Hodarchaeota archaeon]
MIYEEIFKEFELRGVRYLVVGGMAVNLYGYIRLTMDLDIMVDLSDKNLSQVVDVMEKFGYTPRLPVNPHEFISEEKTDEWIKEKGTVVFTFIDLKKPFKQIDIFLSNPIDFEEAYSRREVMTIGGAKVSEHSVDRRPHKDEGFNRKAKGHGRHTSP